MSKTVENVSKIVDGMSESAEGMSESVEGVSKTVEGCAWEIVENVEFIASWSKIVVADICCLTTVDILLFIWFCKIDEDDNDEYNVRFPIFNVDGWLKNFDLLSDNVGSVESW